MGNDLDVVVFVDTELPQLSAFLKALKYQGQAVGSVQFHFLVSEQSVSQHIAETLHRLELKLSYDTVEVKTFGLQNVLSKLLAAPLLSNYCLFVSTSFIPHHGWLSGFQKSLCQRSDDFTVLLGASERFAAHQNTYLSHALAYSGLRPSALEQFRYPWMGFSLWNACVPTAILHTLLQKKLALLRQPLHTLFLQWLGFFMWQQGYAFEEVAAKTYSVLPCDMASIQKQMQEATVFIAEYQRSESLFLQVLWAPLALPWREPKALQQWCLKQQSTLEQLTLYLLKTASQTLFLMTKEDTESEEFQRFVQALLTYQNICYFKGLDMSLLERDFVLYPAINRRVLTSGWDEMPSKAFSFDPLSLPSGQKQKQAYEKADILSTLLSLLNWKNGMDSQIPVVLTPHFLKDTQQVIALSEIENKPESHFDWVLFELSGSVLSDLSLLFSTLDAHLKVGGLLMVTASHTGALINLSERIGKNLPYLSCPYYSGSYFKTFIKTKSLTPLVYRDLR